MRSLNRCLLYAVCSLLALGLLLVDSAQAQATDVAQSATIDQHGSELAGTPIPEYAALAELPDSPGSTRAQEQATPGQQTTTEQQSSSTPQAPSPGNAQGNEQANQKLQRPVGTAAAEAPKVSGITAAEPAGIAIAPAKQHRVRTIVIKVGAIIGASAALGTVIALTAATPSKPPGAH